MVYEKREGKNVDTVSREYCDCQQRSFKNDWRPRQIKYLYLFLIMVNLIWA